MIIRKLKTKKHKVVVPKLNKILRILVDMDYKKYKKHSLIIPVLQDEEIAEYQSTLLEHYMTNFKLDLDKLEFTIKCKKSNGEQGKSKLIKCLETNLTTVKAPVLKDMISASKNNVGNINKNTELSRKSRRPFYSSVLDICVNDDPIKVAKVYISNGVKEYSKAGIRVSFNPNHFTQREMSAVFMHIESTVGKTHYHSMMNRAKVTRIDVGFNAYGLCSLFSYSYLQSLTFKGSDIYTEDENIAETVVHGTDSQIKQYDKTLQTLRKHDSCELGQMAMTTRYEYQCRRKGKSLIKSMEDCPLSFGFLRILDPKVIASFDSKTLRTLLAERGGKEVQAAIVKYEERTGEEAKVFSLDANSLKAQQTKLLLNVKKLLMKPRKNFKRLSK